MLISLILPTNVCNLLTLCRTFISSTDINDHKLLEHKLKEAHNAAQKSTESKTRFLSNMSHGKRGKKTGSTLFVYLYLAAGAHLS